MTSFFDDSSRQGSDTLQSALDTLNFAMPDHGFNNDAYSVGVFDHNPSTETAYQTDHFPTENTWHDTAFHSAPEYSLTQDIDSLLDSESTHPVDHFSVENYSNVLPLTDSGHTHHVISSTNEGSVSLYFNQESSHQNFDPSNPGGEVIGHPSYDMQFWHKQSFDDCDVVAQQMGLESLTAQHFSESTLLHEAIKDGSHLPNGGTPVNYIGHLYETHGFPIERHHEGTLDEIQQKLVEGQKIVVAVNSTVLWANEAHVPEFNTLSANHSVEVIGVVYPYGDHEHPKVILNDPGIDNGQGVMVPLEQFEKAWATSQHLVATTSLPDTHVVLRDSYDDMARANLAYKSKFSRSSFYQ
ncbi:MAG: hypothetical protein R3E08_15055 [Thiotrichaceae bacterium]